MLREIIIMQTRTLDPEFILKSPIIVGVAVKSQKVETDKKQTMTRPHLTLGYLHRETSTTFTTSKWQGPISLTMSIDIQLHSKESLSRNCCSRETQETCFRCFLFFASNNQQIPELVLCGVASGTTQFTTSPTATTLYSGISIGCVKSCCIESYVGSDSCISREYSALSPTSTQS